MKENNFYLNDNESKNIASKYEKFEKTALGKKANLFRKTSIITSLIILLAAVILLFIIEEKLFIIPLIIVLLSLQLFSLTELIYLNMIKNHDN